MTISNKTTIKAFFETGDFPTQSNFSDFIDSSLFLAESTAQAIAGSISIAGSCAVSGDFSTNNGTFNKVISSAGSFTTVSATNGVFDNITVSARITNAALAQMAAGTYKSNLTAATANAADNRFPAVANCQFQRSSSTQVVLMPKNGNQILFPNGYLYSIGSSGLLSGSINGGCNLNGTGSSTLTAATLYYVYLWYNSGTPALDFSATGHATDATTGIEIKSGDATRVLVGMVYPQTGPVLTDSTTARLVASWFNRQKKYFTNSFTTNRTTASATPVEVNTEIRGLFLTWGETFSASYAGSVTHSGASNTITTSICIDGVSTTIATSNPAEPTAAYNCNAACAGDAVASEGEHFLTIGGSTSTPTATWASTGSQLVGNVFI